MTQWLPRDFSDAERCLRIPHLRRLPSDLVQVPIREAIEARLTEGIAAIHAGRPDAGREQVVDAFLTAAVAPGYLYPDVGDAYEIINDYASWLDGALRLVAEHAAMATPLPVLTMGRHQVALDAWLSTDNVAYVYQVVAHKLAIAGVEDLDGEDSPAPDLRWPGLLASLHPDVQSVRLTRLRLPAFRSTRLHSPLMLAYEHPATGQLRLQRLSQEGTDDTKVGRRATKSPRFSSLWKQVGRWERPDIAWEEWREGIDRDECLAGVIDIHDYPVASREVKADALGLLKALDQPLAALPRLRETCNHCDFKGVCHDGRPTTDPDSSPRAARARPSRGLATVG